MITDEPVRRGGPEEEMVRLAQQGKIETVVSHKEQITLSEIFNPLPLVLLPPPSLPRIILIEGAPGVGKSTLALHICDQWAQGILFLDRFDIVVLVYLRDQAIQNASTLADILPSNKRVQTDTVATQIEARSGLNTLFIFDGWDEFPPHMQDHSLVSSIIKEPHKLSLHKSTVLITSRPVSSGDLLHIINKRVEILGFTQCQIREYIERALSGNSAHIQKLVQHLEDHPVIEGYCYVPLHAAMLVHIFLTMKGALPTTYHELFCDLVLCSIIRELSTHQDFVVDLSEISTLDDLPSVLKAQLNHLSVLAYEGVMQDKVVFYQKDLQDLQLHSKFATLGLIQGVEGLTKFSKSTSYNFLHLSVQELLAAYHISRMNPSSRQVEVFKHMLESSRFQSVLCYYCGFTKLADPAIRGFISSYCQFRWSSFDHIRPILHCLYETQKPSLCHLVDPHFDNDLTDLRIANFTSVDLLAIGFVVASILSASTSDETKKIDLELSDFDDHNKLKLFFTGLSSCPVQGQATTCDLTRRSLGLKISVKRETTCKLIADYLMSSSPIVWYLEINFFFEDDNSLQFLTKALQTNTSVTLLRLYSQNKLPALDKVLQQNKTLTHLGLSELYSVKSIFQGLQHNTTLVNLDMSNSQISAGEDTLQALSDMLRVNKSLTRLYLSNNEHLTDSGLHYIFIGLQHNSTLVTLDLSNTGITATEHTLQALGDMLRVNKSLTHLNLSNNKHLTDSGSHYIFIGLQHNSTLVYLNLSNTGITATEHTLQALGDMLRVNKSLIHLDLSNNKHFIDSGAYCIFIGLQHNSTLVYLNLYNTGITATEHTLQALGEMLRVNKSLTRLDLSNNEKLGDLAACSIIHSLQHNTAMVDLYLSNTGLTATEDITQALDNLAQVNKTIQHILLHKNDKLGKLKSSFFQRNQFSIKLCSTLSNQLNKL